ncbi:hypothetical protein [Dolosicoccus paucivorans]
MKKYIVIAATALSLSTLLGNKVEADSVPYKLKGQQNAQEVTVQPFKVGDQSINISLDPYEYVYATIKGKDGKTEKVKVEHKFMCTDPNYNPMYPNTCNGRSWMMDGHRAGEDGQYTLQLPRALEEGDELILSFATDGNLIYGRATYEDEKTQQNRLMKEETPLNAIIPKTKEDESEKPEGYVTIKFSAGSSNQGVLEGTQIFYVYPNQEITLKDIAPAIKTQVGFEAIEWDVAIQKPQRFDKDRVIQVVYEELADIYQEEKPGYIPVEFRQGEFGELEGIQRFWIKPGVDIQLVSPRVKNVLGYTFKEWDKSTTIHLNEGDSPYIITAQYEKESETKPEQEGAISYVLKNQQNTQGVSVKSFSVGDKEIIIQLEPYEYVYASIKSKDGKSSRVPVKDKFMCTDPNYNPMYPTQCDNGRSWVMDGHRAGSDGRYVLVLPKELEEGEELILAFASEEGFTYGRAVYEDAKTQKERLANDEIKPEVPEPPKESKEPEVSQEKPENSGSPEVPEEPKDPEKSEESKEPESSEELKEPENSQEKPEEPETSEESKEPEVSQEEPENPEEPNEPEVSESPESPESSQEIPEESQTPELSKESESSEPSEQPEVPEEPKEPEKAEEPKNPETSPTPEVSNEPESLKESEYSDISEKPETSEEPKEPEKAEESKESENSETPERPEASEESESSEISEKPEEPETSEEPKEPEKTEDSKASENPESPESSETSEKPEESNESESSEVSEEPKEPESSEESQKPETSDDPENPEESQVPESSKEPENSEESKDPEVSQEKPENSEESSKPESPEQPEMPNNPETPQSPPEPEAPQAPGVPERPEVSPAPEVPQSPEVPQVPEPPLMPEVPEAPQVPEVPQNPEVPQVPEVPQAPEMSPGPEIPQIPEMSPAPEVPQSPEILQVPDIPLIPEIPQESETSPVPEEPKEPEASEKPKVSREPQIIVPRKEIEMPRRLIEIETPHEEVVIKRLQPQTQDLVSSEADRRDFSKRDQDKESLDESSSITKDKKDESKQVAQNARTDNSSTKQDSEDSKMIYLSGMSIILGIMLFIGKNEEIAKVINSFENIFAFIHQFTYNSLWL